MTNPVRLAIVDDHAMLLESMVAWIRGHAPDFSIVAAATTWPALVHSPEFPADLVLMDFQLGDAISLEARIRTCRAAGSEVIVFSGAVGGQPRERALAAGALAFLSKTMPMEAMLEAVRVAAGVQPVVQAPAPLVAKALAAPKLSAGERAALELYAAGLSINDIAERLDVGYETAKTFLRRVREKYRALGRPAGRRTELTLRAAEDGFLQEP